MKRNNFLFIILLFSISACSFMDKYERSEMFVLTNELDEVYGINHYSDLQRIWSPNAKWVVNVFEDFIDNKSLSKIKFISFPVPNEMITQEEFIDYGDYITPRAWSPNGEYVLFYGRNQIGSGCQFNRFMIYSLDDKNRVVTSNMYELDEDKTSCFWMQWAPDSEKLVAVIEQKIYIFDSMANLLEVHQPALSEGMNLINMKWLDSNYVAYKVRDNISGDNIEYRMMKSSTGEETILFNINTDINLIGLDPSAMILVYIEQENEDDGYFYIKMLDLETWGIIESVKIYGQQGNFALSGNQRYVGLSVVDFSNTEGKNISDILWVYDWSSKEYSIISNVYRLIEWSDELKSFIVVSQSSNEQLIVESIIPK
jgi:hypothetical protein